MDLVAILKGKSDLFDGSQIGAQLVARRERARNAAAARNPTRNAVRKRLLFLVCSSNRVCVWYGTGRSAEGTKFTGALDALRCLPDSSRFQVFWRGQKCVPVNKLNKLSRKREMLL